MRSFAGMLLAAGLLLPLGGGAHRKTEKGNRLYAEGRSDDALRAYTEAQVDAPEAQELYYDIGNVLYRKGDYEGAAESYTRALLSGSESLTPLAAYNLGNARYQQQSYDEAVRAYERALRARPNDEDAKRNLELALRALEAQQQQQQGGQEQEQQPDEKRGEQGGEDREGQEQKQDQNEGQEPSGGESQEKPSGREQGQEDQGPGMTGEQAARLLDGLKEEELENLRQLARRKAAAPAPATEKDW